MRYLRKVCVCLIGNCASLGAPLWSFLRCRGGDWCAEDGEVLLSTSKIPPLLKAREKVGRVVINRRVRSYITLVLEDPGSSDREGLVELRASFKTSENLTPAILLILFLYFCSQRECYNRY